MKGNDNGVDVEKCEELEPSTDTVNVSELCAHWFAEPETAFGHVIFFALAVILLTMSLLICPLCIWGVLVFSCVFCIKYRSINLILWACIVVLWFMGWRFNFGYGLTMSWS